ncbi:polyphenol oxidase family protein [Solirubrobacter taibaiensis]|nr:polyphenol oxidase family protein [Solirubrobacter taibaiensis]
MRLEERGERRVWRFDSLPDAFVSTRSCGNLAYHVTPDKRSVDRNRQALFSSYGLSLERSAWCEQVHGGEIAVATAAGSYLGADALVTDRAGLTLCVLMADCVPLVLADLERGALGVVHAGRLGTMARIASTTVRVMVDRFGVDPSRLRCAIGPSIGPEDYEVGPDVTAQLSDRTVLRPIGGGGKALLDLWEANVRDLETAGVPRANVEIAGVSTARSLEDFFSHRAEPDGTGRFATIATLRV